MPGILCEHCTALCCRYVALPIEPPETRQDYDDIRWYLLHDGISVFIEDGEWYLNVQTTCRHLQPDQCCGIYQTRPRICRDYSTENCDYHSGDYGWDAHFTSPEHLEEYYRNQRRGPAARRRRPPARRRDGSHLRTATRSRPRRPARSTRARTDTHGVPLPLLPSRS